MLHFIHNGKAIALLGEKAIPLESLVSIEIEHLKAQTLICGMQNKDNLLSQQKENLFIVGAQATYGEVSISSDSKSLLYIFDHKYNKGDVISYTVKNDAGCVGSLALVIRNENNAIEKKSLFGGADFDDDIVSSIVLVVTYEEDDVVIVDRFSIDIGSYGNGILSHDPHNRNFEISSVKSIVVGIEPEKKENTVYINKSLVDADFFVTYDKSLLEKTKTKRVIKTPVS